MEIIFHQFSIPMTSLWSCSSLSSCLTLTLPDHLPCRIYEAIDNREQKKQQREREYERKREEKRRARVLYHMRHTKNYEALELPPGATKSEVKKAYRSVHRSYSNTQADGKGQL